MTFRETSCTYCGEPSDSMDHVVPVSVDETSRKNAKWSRKHVVPCCRECNNLLGSVYLLTVWERAGFIEGKLSNRYKKVLNCPAWDPEDLEELSYKLRKDIETTIEARRVTLCRVQHAEWVYESGIGIEDVWESIDGLRTNQTRHQEEDSQGECK